MSMQHTPGPWPYEGGDNNSVDIILPNDTTVSIDRSSRHTGQHVISREEMEANARLIAAAPEMLQMLKQLLPIIDWAEFPKEAADTRLLIAKATTP